MDETSAPGDTKGLSGEAQANRQLLFGALEKTGLTNYLGEWWHWSYGDSGWALRVGAKTPCTTGCRKNNEARASLQMARASAFGNSTAFGLPLLVGRANQDLVDVDARRLRDGVEDGGGDVLALQWGHTLDERLDLLLGLGCVMCSVSSVATAPGSMIVTRIFSLYNSCRATPRTRRPPLAAIVDAGTRPRGPARDVETLTMCPPLRAHQRQRGMGGGHQAQDVGVDHPPPVLGVGAADRAEQHHARIVDQDVYAPEGGVRGHHHLPRLVLLGDIGHDRLRLPLPSLP